MSIGNRLRSLREKESLSQIELSKRLRITSQALSQYELNKRIPDIEMLKKLSNFFNVSVDYLLGLTDVCYPIGELIKQGTVKVEEPSEIEQIFKGLPDQERKEAESYVKYLDTKSKLTGSEKESSATLEAIEEKKVN